MHLKLLENENQKPHLAKEGASLPPNAFLSNKNNTECGKNMHT